MLRAFLALDLDERFLADVAALSASLRSDAALARARWVASHVMHVTLRFLGDTDEALVPALGDLVVELGEGRTANMASVRATSLVAFPAPRRARVLGVALEDGGLMGAIAAEAERALASLGFTPEARAFRAHLTLARLREPADLRRLVAERHVELRGRVVAITLYKSELGQNGPTYTPLARAPLALDS